MVSVPLSWSEQHEELKAERDRLQAVVENQARSLAGVALELRAALDGRDRLREAIDADRPMQIANLKALIAERDWLRAILDALSKQAVEAEGQENVDDY